ncbi:unnamed protein product [Mytilus coruscus]|uniref:Uncharacterized protein n=1 Tax=Mytilus coruscus TaxID=42192 RepID=A0A6J8DE05_MYTCO|nr:unnamed protein product [Mytilus coruscus]
MAEPVVSPRKTRGYERDKQAPTKDNTSSINIQLSPKSKNRYAQKAFRERIKLDETLYKEYRQFETLRVKAFRVNMSPEQKEKYNEKTRLRMKKYREKKKSEGTDTASHPKPKTRKEKEKQREKWRKDKQLQRDNLNPQKKRRINEKRRKQYELQKQKTAPIDINTESDKTSTVPETASSSGYQTKCARRKAVSRSIKIKKNPDKFAEVVATIIKNSTPRKKAALKNKCIASPSSKKKLEYLESSCKNFKNTLREIKKKRSKKDNKMRRILHHMVLAKSKFSASNSLYEQFGLSRNITRRVKRGEDILNKERKKRKDAVSEEEVNHIQEFYKMAYVSREMPNVNVIKKDLSVKMTLEGSLKRTYDQYNNENPEKKISYAKFAQLRPKTYYHVKKTKVHAMPM